MILNFKYIFMKHGMKGTRIYVIWANIKQRCNNPNATGYKYWGGKGIKYDPLWETFEGFYKDMGESYQDGLTIERINNDWGYSKHNCKWIPNEEQSKNINTNIMYKGKCLSDWCKDLGLKYNTIHKRVYRGSSIKKALGF